MRVYVANIIAHGDGLHLKGIATRGGTRGMNLTLINSVEDGATVLSARFTPQLDVSS
jgi:hypothetical protein